MAFEALKAVHDHKVVQQDFGERNFVYRKKGSGWQVLVVDFGHASSGHQCVGNGLDLNLGGWEPRNEEVLGCRELFKAGKWFGMWTPCRHFFVLLIWH